MAVLLLAYANGANDNFKGVATLLGSDTTSYRRALQWATISTFLGSLAAVFLAQTILKSFSGRGLIDGTLVADPRYIAAVALGAGLTVLLATRVGMPVSSTHGLIGALVGAGLAAGSAVNVAKLASDFFAPLLLSPLIAVTLTAVAYPALHGLRRWLGITHETCICAGTEIVETIAVAGEAGIARRVAQLSLALGTPLTCKSRYQGRMLGVQAAGVLDRLHVLSAGVVGFARGLNDTPKIAALLLVVPALGSFGGICAVGVVIAAGGLLGARRVAETMSCKITPMNHGQGFTANLVTGFVVIAASRFGLPVSTTHVSCGALFGIGTVTRQARWATIARILAAWFTTLPAGAALGAVAYMMIR